MKTMQKISWIQAFRLLTRTWCNNLVFSPFFLNGNKTGILMSSAVLATLIELKTHGTVPYGYNVLSDFQGIITTTHYNIMYKGNFVNFLVTTGGEEQAVRHITKTISGL
jgi:hypothetical protein